jgi:hypothetical protein
MTQQPGWKYTGVVDDHQIAGPKYAGDIGEPGVLDRACSAIQHEQSRGASFGGRVLGDQLIRQLEIEFGDVHRSHHT